MNLSKSKAGKYNRLFNQIKALVVATENPVSRMATISALLHHKMSGYYWTGFYFLEEGELIVGPYQGPIACLKLKKDTGVCWKGIKINESVVVGDVHQFPGHIACSTQSNSEIVVPVRDKAGEVVALLDVDSRELNRFDDDDRIGLEKIATLIYDV